MKLLIIIAIIQYIVGTKIQQSYVRFYTYTKAYKYIYIIINHIYYYELLMVPTIPQFAAMSY